MSCFHEFLDFPWCVVPESDSLTQLGGIIGLPFVSFYAFGKNL